MDELESAVVLCMTPTAEKNLRDQALQYCENLRTSKDGWAFVLQHISISMRPEVAFWCLGVIHETLSDTSRYPSQFMGEQVIAIRNKISEYFSQVLSPENLQNGSGTATSPLFPKYLLNKLAQIIVSLIGADYPESWPKAFQDFVLPLSNPQQSTNESISMFFRLLRALDEDITSIRATQVSEMTRTRSIRVKDAMRDDCIVEIIARCASLILSPEHVSHAFDIVGRYVEWVDIGIIVQDGILTPMYASITHPSPNGARPAAAAALRAILTKRMDSVSKLELMTKLRILELMQSIPADRICAIDDEFGDPELNLQTGQVEVASLVNTSAVVALDILKETLKPSNTSENSSNVAAAAGNIAQVALPVALRFLHEDADEGTSSHTLQCVTNYVNVFSRMSAGKVNGTSAPNMAPMSAILKVVEERSIFGTHFDPQDENSDEHRSFFELRRVLLKNIFSSVARTFPDMCLEYINGLFTKATAGEDVPRIELTLSMLNALMAANPDAAGLDGLRVKIITNPPSCMNFNTDRPDSEMERNQVALKHQLERVSTTYFDLVARSYRLFLTKGDPNLLSVVLPVFINGRGLGHSSSEAVRSHASYALLKLIRPLRGIVAGSHLEAVLNAIRMFMFPLHKDTGGQASKDQMNVFETVGYLLGSDHKNEGSKQYLSAVLQTLIEGLQTSHPMDAIPYIFAAGFLSKGFGGDTKPLLLLNEAQQDRSPGPNTKAHGPTDTTTKEVKIQKVTPLSQDMQRVWISCLEAVLKVSSPCFSAHSDPNVEEIRAKLLFFLHRMVDTIGIPVLAYLEQALPSLLNASSSAVDARDVVILVSQAGTKFGVASEKMVMGIFAHVVARAHQLKYELDPTTLTALSEESREGVELHRAYTYLLHAIVGTKLINVLIHPNHQGMLQGVMTSMLSGAIGDSLDLRVAGSVMKMSLHSLSQMIDQWIEIRSDGTIGSQGPPGFADFVLKEISNASVLSGVRGVVFRGGDILQGESASVLTEIVALQRNCAKHLGQTFGEALRGGALSQLPLERVNAYLTALYSTEMSNSNLTHALGPLLKMLQAMQRSNS